MFTVRLMMAIEGYLEGGFRKSKEYLNSESEFVCDLSSLYWTTSARTTTKPGVRTS